MGASCLKKPGEDAITWRGQQKTTERADPRDSLELTSDRKKSLLLLWVSLMLPTSNSCPCSINSGRLKITDRGIQYLFSRIWYHRRHQRTVPRQWCTRSAQSLLHCLHKSQRCQKRQKEACQQGCRSYDSRYNFLQESPEIINTRRKLVTALFCVRKAISCKLCKIKTKLVEHTSKANSKFLTDTGYDWKSDQHSREKNTELVQEGQHLITTDVILRVLQEWRER